MNQENVTLIAALVAALASLFSLLISLFAQRTSELRVSYRKYLEPYLSELGDLLHQTVATTNMLVRETDENHEIRYQNWRRTSTDAANRLKVLRPKLRYSLWGLDEGIRVITRFPNWVDQNRKKPDVKKLLRDGDWLRRAIDFAVRKSYQNGRLPSLFERCLVNTLANNLRKTYSSFAQANHERDDDLED